MRNIFQELVNKAGLVRQIFIYSSNSKKEFDSQKIIFVLESMKADIDEIILKLKEKKKRKKGGKNA